MRPTLVLLSRGSRATFTIRYASRCLVKAGSRLQGEDLSIQLSREGALVTTRFSFPLLLLRQVSAPLQQTQLLHRTDDTSLSCTRCCCCLHKGEDDICHIRPAFSCFGLQEIPLTRTFLLLEDIGCCRYLGLAIEGAGMRPGGG